MKRCSKCKRRKHKSKFGKDRRTKDGLRYQCKDCQRVYRQSDSRKKAQLRYDRSEKGKATKLRYGQRVGGKEARRAYEQSGTRKTARLSRERSKAYKETRLRYRQSDVGKIAKRRQKLRKRLRLQTMINEYDHQIFDDDGYLIN